MEKYAFGDIIGHGNYGTCHIVTHKKENRHYVAKRIPVHDVAARGEALAEAQLLSKIKHPTVIAYKESFLSSPDDDDDDDAARRRRVSFGDRNRKIANRRRRLRGGDCLCIVTAYAEEGDLFTHIKRARESNPRRYFPERQVLDWTAQIALALDHIHAMRVMHRDLKTQNIFLGRGGVVKLGDFGISRVLERTDDFATTVAGTPYYLSPEVCQNQPYTLKSDVWSFGCVACEIAALEHAFAADSRFAGVPDRQRDVRLLGHLSTVRRAVLRLDPGDVTTRQREKAVGGLGVTVGDHAGPPEAHAATDWRGGKRGRRAAAATAHRTERQIWIVTRAPKRRTPKRLDDAYD